MQSVYNEITKDEIVNFLRYLKNKYHSNVSMNEEINKFIGDLEYGKK
jgi:hypothetical protein